MDKIKLWCGVYGGGNVFSVEVERNAKVSALREAIIDRKRYKELYGFDASALTLYLARKEGGVWLKDDERLDALLQGGISTDYEEMRPSWKLAKRECLGRISRLEKKRFKCWWSFLTSDRPVACSTSTEDAAPAVLDSGIERTIKRSQCSDAEDFDRLVSIYKTFRKLSTKGSPGTHLQTVGELTVKRSYPLVVGLSPIGCRRYPTTDETSGWLRDMLTALKYWHGREYCHGDVRWRDIVFVPTAGSGYWMLIDMDESRQPNTTIIEWSHEFNGDKLRSQHDLYQLGELLEDVSFELPDDLKAMQTILLSAVNTPEVTAEVALAKLAEHI
ncbi:hypothetical protein BBJ28_00026504 [Nothophytophthora sp. Chile5]|nr:hypothetical protein BBJ28_00026504 [Nothophytophthora sp. Chile5]